MARAWQGLTTLVAVMVVAAGCGGAPASLRPISSEVATPAAPTESPSTPSSTPEASARPSPTSVSVVDGWSKPAVIRKGECSQLTAAIDTRGHDHVAAVCDGGIRYLTSADGIDWIETSLVPPIDRLELDPQLTLDGDTVFLAYSLLAPTDGGCGGDGLQDVGVYTRSLRPDGSWSDRVRIGAVGDRVQSFRAAGGVLHLIVKTKDGAGPLYYESQSGKKFARVQLPGAIAASVRVGDDGLARIGYTTGHAIKYARVQGTRLSVATISASDQTNLLAPLLVLGSGDRAYLVWTQTTDGGGGCAAPDPGPLDGTYFATDRGGAWKTTRLTDQPGETSSALDPSSGRIEVVVSYGSSVTELASTGGATWTTKTIADTVGVWAPVVRLNPVNGRASIFALGSNGISILMELAK